MKQSSKNPKPPAQQWTVKYSGHIGKPLWNIFDDAGILVCQSRNRVQARLIASAPALKCAVQNLLEAFDLPEMPTKKMAPDSAIRMAREALKELKK